MKNITFALIFCLSIISAKAQNANIPGPDLQEKAAGFELVKATKHFYTGAIIVGGGTIFSIIGSVQALQSPQNPGSGGGFVVIGDLAVITGFVFMIESYSHIGRAGKILMQRNDLTIGPNSHGFGATFHF